MSDPLVQETSNCLFCKKAGITIYNGVRDFLFENAGEYSFRRCASCGLLWLSPRPVPGDMGRFYGNYYTHAIPETDEHGAAPGSRFLGGFRNLLRDSILCGYYGYRLIHPANPLCGAGRYLGRIPFLRERAANEYRALLPLYRKDGRLVDVGCGSGDFLLGMKGLGWDVLGIETDPLAAQAAVRRGLKVESRPLEKAGLPDNWADAVTMNHVIEHLYDPVSALKECFRILKKDGRLAFYTPNALSLGALVFGRHWRGLEPPRHLYVFSPHAIRAALSEAGFRDVQVRTSARNAVGLYNASVEIAREGNSKGSDAPRRKGSAAFKLAEAFLCALGASKGEELEVVAYK